MDKLTGAMRSENMRRIRSKDMKPEMTVRSLAHQLGYRYRLHRKDLPGSPDLVFPSRKKVIFVHGCFWHGHEDFNCIDGRRKPKSNLAYWLPKLARNKARDQEQIEKLEKSGWSTLTIWECQTRNLDDLTIKIEEFLA